MDGDLHLLRMMHQQLEEARALGHREPRLEFQEDASGLTVRVAGTDAVEEIRYGGLYREDEQLDVLGDRLIRNPAEEFPEHHAA